MTVPARERAIGDFESKQEVFVLLVRAGGAGGGGAGPLVTNTTTWAE